MALRETGNGRAISVMVAGPRRRAFRIERRVGSATAANTRPSRSDRRSTIWLKDMRAVRGCQANAGSPWSAPAPSGRAAGSERRSARGVFVPVPLEEHAPRHPDLAQLRPVPLGEARAALGMVAGEHEPLPPGEPPPRERGERPVLEPGQGGLLPEEARAPDDLD